MEERTNNLANEPRQDNTKDSMPNIDSPLLKDVKGLKEHIKKWSQDEILQEKHKQIVKAIFEVNYRAEIFRDQQYPEAALLAYVYGDISIAQFATIMNIWAPHQDYTDIKLVKHRLDSESVTLQDKYLLKKFLVISKPPSNSGNSTARKFKFTNEEFEQILSDINAKDIPNSEKIFFTCRVSATDLPAIYSAFTRVGHKLLTPIKENNDYYQLIIASHSLQQIIINHVGKFAVKLSPTIGSTTLNGLLRIHQHNEHPMGLSFPSYEHDKADGHKTGRKGFIDHDFYHSTLLACNPLRAAFNHMSTLVRKFQAENGRSESTSKVVAHLIDQEFAPFLRTERTSRMLDINEGEAKSTVWHTPIFMVHLFQMMLRNIHKSIDKHFGESNNNIKNKMDEAKSVENKRKLIDNLISNSKIDKQLWQLFKYILSDMMSNSNYWKDCLGISVIDFFMLTAKSEAVMSDVALADYLTEIKKDIFGGVMSLDHYTLIRMNIEIEKRCRKFIREFFQKKQLENDNTAKEIDAHTGKIQSAIANDNDSELKKMELSHPGISSTVLQIDPAFSYVDKTPRLKKLVESGKISVLQFVLERNPLGLNGIIGESHKIEMGWGKEIICGRRLVHIAAQSGNKAMLKLLIDLGADTNVYDENDATLLSICLQNGNIEGAKLCLQSGVSIAYLKHLKNDEKIAKNCQALVNSYCDVHAKVQQYMENNDIDKLIKLTETTEFPLSCFIFYSVYSQPNQKLIRDANCSYETVLHKYASQLAFSEEDISKYKKLFNAVGELNQVDGNNNTPLEKYLKHKLFSKRTKLLDSHNSLESLVTLGEVKKVLEQPIDYEWVSFLLENGATIRLDSEESLLDIAIKMQDFKLFHLLLSSMSITQQQMILNSIPEIISNLLIAKSPWEDKNIEFFKKFITLGLDLNKSVSYQKSIGLFSPVSRTTTLWAYCREIRRTKQQTTTLFNIPGLTRDKYDEQIIMPLAVRKFCIEQGANPNKPSLEGKKHELIYAIEQHTETKDMKWLDYIDLIIKHGASINKCFALHTAVKLSNTDAVKALLKHNPDLTLLNNDRKSLTDLVSKTDTGEFIQFLLEKNKKGNNSTPLLEFAHKNRHKTNYRKITTANDYNVGVVHEQLIKIKQKVTNYFDLSDIEAMTFISTLKSGESNVMMLCFQFANKLRDLKEIKSEYIKLMDGLIQEHQKFYDMDDKNNDKKVYAQFRQKAVVEIMEAIDAIKKHMKDNFTNQLKLDIDADHSHFSFAEKLSLPGVPELNVICKELKVVMEQANEYRGLIFS